MRRLIYPMLSLVVVVALLAWRFIWPERTLTLRVPPAAASPVMMVELGTTALWGRADRNLLAAGTPVLKRYAAQSAYSRFLWLAQDADGTYHAFVPKDPLSGCVLAYSAPLQQFHDPCWGAHYDLSGKHVAGPGTAALWSQPVVVSEGQITVDLARAPTSE